MKWWLDDIMTGWPSLKNHARLTRPPNGTTSPRTGSRVWATLATTTRRGSSTSRTGSRKWSRSGSTVHCYSNTMFVCLLLLTTNLCLWASPANVSPAPGDCVLAHILTDYMSLGMVFITNSMTAVVFWSSEIYLRISIHFFHSFCAKNQQTWMKIRTKSV